MSLEQLARANSSFLTPRFDVRINDNKLPADMAIIDISVDEKIDVGASFKLTIHDEFDMATQQFKWLDHPILEVGDTIAIKMGYESNLLSLLMGNITSIEPSFFSGDTPTLTIGGQDLSYDYLKRNSPERTFIDKSYAEIAEIIASDAGLLSIVDDTVKISHPVCKKNDQNFFSFLEQLAKEVGFQFKMDGQTMYFAKPTDSVKEILTLELGKDIISFHPTMKTTGLISEVEVRGHNPRDPSKPIIGRAGPGDERTQESDRKSGSQIMQDKNKTVKKVITNVIVNSEEQANALALSELNKASDSLIEGDVECIGLPQIRTGVTVCLEKMGKRFSGKYYVTGTNHTIGEGGYRTRFSVKRNAI